jgi:hypothetical protein
MGVPDLATALKSAGVTARIEIYSTGSADPSEAQAVWLGKNVPPEIAVKAIHLAGEQWPFLRYVILSDEVRDIPESMHDEVFFGASTKAATTRRLQPWTEEDFRGLQPSMSLAQLHKYVRSRYGADYARRKA